MTVPEVVAMHNAAVDAAEAREAALAAELEAEQALPTEGVEEVERDHPAGLLRFENYPAGTWRTQKGDPAKKDRRRYLLNGKELPAVSSITGILGAEALVWWAEDHGMRGAVEAERRGLLKGVEPEDFIRVVKAEGLGASAARDEGAARGQAIHAAFEALARGEGVPNPADYPAAWRPYVTGCVRAWMDLDVTDVVEVEYMVCHPELGFAGRLDLLARCGKYDGALTLLDYKTGKGKVYDRAHLQTRLYDLALRVEGISAERVVIVGIDDAGGFEPVENEAADEDALALLQVFTATKQINAGMARQRREAKKAAKA